MSETKNAAAKRAGFLDALLREREGYVIAGKTDRVAQVDAQIKAYGGQPPVERRAPRSAKSEA